MLAIAMMATLWTVSAQQYTTLGIGISNPVGTLHVHSSTIYDPPLPPILRTFANDYLTIVRITNTNTGTSDIDGFSIKQYNYDVTFRQHENGLVMFQNNSGMITMTRAGGLSIGDSVTAGYKLDVNGNSRLRGNAVVSGNTSIGGNLTASGSATIGSGFSVTPTGNLTVGGSATIGNGFFCDAQGNAKVKSLHVTLTDWPDYVFTDRYTLMPLGELEGFIAANGHLPQVPSAAAVDEDGVDVGEMNKVLLQKVEELTLYIIDLQKQIDELKAN